MEGYYFYILQSTTTDRYYIGSCVDLKQRVLDHNRGNTKSTRNRGPWVVVYNEKYRTLREARARERRVKRWKSKKMIEKLINKER